jgi:hypothetical protein
MLTITPRALAVARRVTAHPLLNATAGLRIDQHRNAAAPLHVGTAHGPSPGDTTPERDGAVLSIGASARSRLEGGELDAVAVPDGRVQFLLKTAA